MSFLLVSLCLVGGLRSTLSPIREDIQEGCDSSWASIPRPKAELSNLRASGSRDIEPDSISNTSEEEQPHRDISLWGRINELRGSIPDFDEQRFADAESRGGLKSSMPPVQKAIEYLNRMSRGAQMLEATLSEIGRRSRNADDGGPCSEAESRLYTCLRIHINGIMTPHKTEHDKKKEIKLEKLLSKEDQHPMNIEKAKARSLSGESLGQQLQRQIKEDIISKQRVKWNQAVVLRGFQEIFSDIKAHEVKFKDIFQSGDKLAYWFKLRTDIEKVIFGAINYMYQLRMIKREKIEDFLKGPGILEILGIHLHNVYQLAEVSEFEPTVEFLANTNHSTWYMHDCLTDLDKNIQKFLIHAVLSRTCQSFVKYCSAHDIAISNRFKEIAEIYSAKEFSGYFNECENKKSLRKHFCTLFRNCAEFFRTGPDTVEGAFFSIKPWRSCKRLIKHGHKDVFSHREISSESQLTSYLINLYILHYTVQFWNPVIKKEVEKVAKKSVNFLEKIEMRKHELYGKGKTETFFHSNKGLCRFTIWIPQK